MNQLRSTLRWGLISLGVQALFLVLSYLSHH
jgi:hypothetical protein